MTEKLYFCAKIHNKMRYILPYIRKYPLSCCCLAAIWVLCLMPIPEIPLSHVRFIDKWTHIALYLCTCGVIWTEYLRHHPLKNQPTTFSWQKILRWGWLAPIIMSGLIELAQAYCTGGTSMVPRQRMKGKTRKWELWKRRSPVTSSPMKSGFSNGSSSLPSSTSAITSPALSP